MPEVNSASPGSSAITPTSRSAQDKRRITFLVTPIVGFVIASNVGTILSAKLVVSSPLLLLGLDSRLRHLVLVSATEVTFFAFVLVAFIRLIGSDPLFYLAGRWYGDSGLRWLEAKSGGSNTLIRWTERMFPKASYFLVALMPNNLVCFLAGETRMSPTKFISLNAFGTMARLLLVWWFGQVFRPQLEAVVRFIGEWQWPITGLLFTIVFIHSFRQAMANIETEQQHAEHEHPMPPHSEESNPL